MKSVLISIQPKWCELIASGKKTIEVRKTRPKIETPFKCYIYQTRERKKKFFNHRFISFYYGKSHFTDMGKVIGEFVCDRIYNITPHEDIQGFVNQYITDWEYGTAYTCLTFDETNEYLKGNNGYGWHISDLVIYDKPKELSEFFHPCPFQNDDNYSRDCLRCDFLADNDYGGICTNIVTRPTQSWCYVEELEEKK